MGETTRKLLAVAARQDGIVCVDDARALGVTLAEFRHARESLGWAEVQPKTYATFATRPTWRQRLRAAFVAAQPGGVVGGAAAAALMQWDGCSESEIVLIVPKSFNRSIRDATVHRSRDLRPEHTWRVSGFEITRPARTLVDLAMTATDDELATVLNGLARRSSNAVLDRLRSELRTFKAQRAGRVVELLSDRIWKPAHPESFLETKLIRVLRESGYAPTIQYELRDGQRTVKRFDAAFPNKCIAVEADGDRAHGAPAQRKRDIAQRNEARALGWQVLETTDAELNAPEPLLRALHFAMSRVPSKPLTSGEMPSVQSSLFDPRPEIRFINEQSWGPAPGDDDDDLAPEDVGSRKKTG